MSKRCFKCGETKAIAEFYRHAAMADGRLGKCKECTKKDARQHRADNLDRCREYDRARANLPHRVRARAEYAKTDRGKERAAEGRKQWLARNPIKRSAHNAVNNAIRDGRLAKAPCVICGSTRRVHGHHDNYERPLDVVWLCFAHHRERHKSLQCP